MAAHAIRQAVIADRPHPSVHEVVHDIAERPVADATVSIQVIGPPPELDVPGRIIFEQLRV